MELRCIPSQLTDIERLLSFMQELYAHDALVFTESAARKALHQLLTNDALGRIWLIECDGAVAGYAVLTFGFSLEFQGRDAFVDELYLRADYRGRGIGRQVLDYIADVCREAGVNALHLEVERANTVAQQVYRKAGFADHNRYLLTRWLISEESSGTAD